MGAHGHVWDLGWLSWEAPHCKDTASLASQCQYVEIIKTPLRIAMNSTPMTERKNKPLVSYVGSALFFQQDPRSHQSHRDGNVVRKGCEGFI